jgi:hypothetical protein
MATQKILKYVIITIVSVTMVTNIQAGILETTITTTAFSQTPRQSTLASDLFSTSKEDFFLPFDSIQYSSISRQQNDRHGAIPWNLRVFTDGINGNRNLLELCQYGETMSLSRSIQDEIPANEALMHNSYKESSLWENQPAFGQSATNSDFERDIRDDWETLCKVGTVQSGSQSTLNNPDFSGIEFGEFYEGGFASGAFCYVNNLSYDLSLFFDDLDRLVVTYRTSENISPATIPEPTTLALLSFGILVLIRKRR